MHLTIGDCNGIVTLRPETEFLDASNSAAFRAAVEQSVPAPTLAVIDLTEIKFIDSSGCGAMLTLLRRATAAGGDLKLCCICPPVRAILQMVRMHRVYDLCVDAAEAASSFHAPIVR